MSVLWTWPLGLAALSALLLPVLLHLDRRRTLRRLPFAAMRWIGSGHPPRRTLRLIEWLLLALRLLLIAAVVLWLAQPFLRGLTQAPQQWLAVAPGVSSDRLQSEFSRVDHAVWLAGGFPTVDQPTPSASQANASLLRELDTQLAANDTLRVLLRATLDGLDAEAIELGRDVDWVIDAQAVVPSAPETDNKDAPALTLAIRHAADDVDALRWLSAASKAWAVDSGRAVETDIAFIDAPLPAGLNALIWIGAQPSPAAWATVEQGATLLQISVEAEEDRPPLWPPSAQRRGKGRLLLLAAPLRPARYPVLHSSEFPSDLRTLLFGAAAAPAISATADVAATRIDREAAVPSLALRPSLAWLIAALFLFERVLANGRRLRGSS